MGVNVVSRDPALVRGRTGSAVGKARGHEHLWPLNGHAPAELGEVADDGHVVALLGDEEADAVARVAQHLQPVHELVAVVAWQVAKGTSTPGNGVRRG